MRREVCQDSIRFPYGVVLIVHEASLGDAEFFFGQHPALRAGL